MEVELISYTKDADNLCASIARSCYSADDAVTIIERGKDLSKTLRRVLKSGHHSVIEHAVFTFNITDVSRVTTHQLVRHRMASYTQMSARYVTLSPLSTVIPDSVSDNEVLRNKIFAFEDAMSDLAEEMRRNGVPEEDIRYIYPNSMRTNIVVTMNARSLWNFFSLRCCERAQWEIRELANKMLTLCKEVAPIIFEDAGKPCIRGECKEGENACKPKKEREPHTDELTILKKYGLHHTDEDDEESSVLKRYVFHDDDEYLIEWGGFRRGCICPYYITKNRREKYKYMPTSAVDEVRLYLRLTEGVNPFPETTYVPVGQNIYVDGFRLVRIE